MYNIDPKIAGWRDFTMIRQEELQRITLEISKQKYQSSTYLLWNLCMANAEVGTGRVLLDREELAELAGVRVEQVSRSMKILDELDAVWTERVKGRNRYRCNGLVGWAGTTKEGIQVKARQIEEGVKQLVRKALTQPDMLN